ncbi:MAG: phosphoribosylglycinamide formyltransferase [Clostridia bacterium]|nr:phosphoribosylglycinamide formyltransferase [Clostridia bacterium]
MLKRPRAAVFVSGGGTNLQALLDKRGSVVTSGDIALVISNNPDAYALERARAAGIDTAYIPFDKNNPYTFENEVSWLLKDKEIDVIVLAGFLCILSAPFTERYDHRIINVHPSLIPSFCGKGFYGLKVHKAALEYGVKVTGATVHYVNAVADGGEIILQKAVEVLEGDTPETLQRRVMEQAEWELLPKALEMVFKKVIEEEGGAEPLADVEADVEADEAAQEAETAASEE